jgi:hypothetical protein
MLKLFDWGLGLLLGKAVLDMLPPFAQHRRLPAVCDGLVVRLNSKSVLDAAVLKQRVNITLRTCKRVGGNSRSVTKSQDVNV